VDVILVFWGWEFLPEGGGRGKEKGHCVFDSSKVSWQLVAGEKSLLNCHIVDMWGGGKRDEREIGSSGVKKRREKMKEASIEAGRRIDGSKGATELTPRRASGGDRLGIRKSRV